MKSYHRKRLKKSIREAILTVLIGTIGGIAIVGMIFGAAIQHQDRSVALATMEVGE